MGLIVAVILVILAVSTTSAFHYEALRRLFGHMGRRRTPETTVIAVIVGLVAVHFAEIVFYALIFLAGAGPLALGGFAGTDAAPGFLDVLHFATETYSTLGYGDILPTGNLRLIAGVESLDGLLLLSWSGSTLFILVRDLESERAKNRTSDVEGEPAVNE